MSQVFAYSYTDPLLESVPDTSIWGRSIDRHYADLGDRSQLAQLLADLQKSDLQKLVNSDINPSPNPDINQIDCLLIRRFEELGDSVAQVSDHLAQLERLGIAVIAIAEPIAGDFIRGTANQSLQRSDLLYLFTAVQTKHRQRQLKRGHAKNRLKALPPPGKAPYGYKRSKDRYTIDRTTAPVIKEFFDHFLLYGSLRGSVRHLQKKYNKRISVSTGKRWLSHPVYRGDLLYQTGEIIQDTHPAILNRDEAAQIDRLLRRNRLLPPRSATAPRSLSGLVTCATCESPMTITRVTARNNSQEYLYLRPTACPNQPRCRAIAYNQILDRTIDQICQDLLPAIEQSSLPDIDRIKQDLTGAIAAKQQILEQLPNLITSGVLDTDTAQLRAYKVQTEMTQLRQQLTQLPPVNLKAIAQVVSIGQFWRDLSEAERRFYFREFIQQIQLIRQGKNWSLQLVFIF